MRVRRNDGRLLGASDIVPVAERLGLVRLLDHRVLELVVEELVAAPSLAGQRQRFAGIHHRPRLVARIGLAAALACRQPPSV